MSWEILLLVFSCPLILAVGWFFMQIRLAKIERKMQEVAQGEHPLD